MFGGGYFKRPNHRPGKVLAQVFHNILTWQSERSRRHAFCVKRLNFVFIFEVFSVWVNFVLIFEVFITVRPATHLCTVYIPFTLLPSSPSSFPSSLPFHFLSLSFTLFPSPVPRRFHSLPRSFYPPPPPPQRLCLLLFRYCHYPLFSARLFPQTYVFLMKNIISPWSPFYRNKLTKRVTCPVFCLSACCRYVLLG